MPDEDKDMNAAAPAADGNMDNAGMPMPEKKEGEDEVEATPEAPADAA